MKRKFAIVGLIVALLAAVSLAGGWAAPFTLGSMNIATAAVRPARVYQLRCLETMMGDRSRSTFLFAVPTWQEGVGRLVDFGDTLTEYNRSSTGASADMRATAQDWLAVGDELRRAFNGACNGSNSGDRWHWS